MLDLSEECLSSATVPYGADETLYIVRDRISGSQEVSLERSDLEATIGDLIAGCFSDPIRVTCFNTLEHWTRDISAEVATEIQARCDIDGIELPDHLSDFVETYACPAKCPDRPGLPELAG